MDRKTQLLVGSPAIALVLLLILSLLGPGGVESSILITLVVLQIVFAGVYFVGKTLFWGKDVVESAAGVDK